MKCLQKTTQLFYWYNCILNLAISELYFTPVTLTSKDLIDEYFLNVCQVLILCLYSFCHKSQYLKDFPECPGWNGLPWE